MNLANTQLLLCQGVDSLPVHKGDSGAPVLWLNGSGGYSIVGIVWSGGGIVGDGPSHNMAWSRWQDITYELGGLSTYLNPVVANHSVTVFGPDCISKVNQTYSWSASVSGGSAPFNYRWEISRGGTDWSDFALDSPQATLRYTSAGVDMVGQLRVTVSSDIGKTIATSAPFAYRESWKRGCTL